MFFRKRRHIKTLSDEELVLEYKESGDSVFVGELFERYTHLVYLVCMKYLKDEMESEDMAMRIFEKLLTDLKKYEVRKFKFWLHTVTKNQCLIWLEKNKRAKEKTDEFLQATPGFVESKEILTLLDGGDAEEEQLNRLGLALENLNEEQRICVELFYLQQKSYQEVADQTGFSMKQVKSYIQNGKRNLKINLSQTSDGAAFEG